MCVSMTTRGPRRKPGASSYSLTRLSLSLSVSMTWWALSVRPYTTVALVLSHVPGGKKGPRRMMMSADDARTVANLVIEYAVRRDNPHGRAVQLDSIITLVESAYGFNA